MLSEDMKHLAAHLDKLHARRIPINSPGALASVIRGYADQAAQMEAGVIPTALITAGQPLPADVLDARDRFAARGQRGAS